ncbi:unnamed protein product, partial [Meganyctiphanes norvegica]
MEQAAVPQQILTQLVRLLIMGTHLRCHHAEGLLVVLVLLHLNVRSEASVEVLLDPPVEIAGYMVSEPVSAVTEDIIGDPPPTPSLHQRSDDSLLTGTNERQGRQIPMMDEITSTNNSPLNSEDSAISTNGEQGQHILIKNGPFHGDHSLVKQIYMDESFLMDNERKGRQLFTEDHIHEAPLYDQHYNDNFISQDMQDIDLIIENHINETPLESQA